MGGGYNGATINDWNAMTSANAVIANNIFIPAKPTVEYISGAFTARMFSNNLYFGGASLPALDANLVIADPAFVSTSDFHLKSTSPAIDQGTNAVSVLVTNDFDVATPRPLGSAIDIGAYEFEGDTQRPRPPTNLRMQ